MREQDVDLSIIVAMTPNRVIGNAGKLPWIKLPSDLSRFRKITVEAGVVIMGHKTFSSIIARNGKPLPERKHIVLSRNNMFTTRRNVWFVCSLEEAVAEVGAHGGKACVIGGGEIFKLFLPLPQVKIAYITTVYAQLLGDTYFPQLSGWDSVATSAIQKRDERDEYETLWEIWKRR